MIKISGEFGRFVVLTEMNFREFLRDRLAAFFTIVFPLMFLASFGATNLLQGSAGLQLAVVGSPTTSDTLQLAHAITAQGLFAAQSVGSKRDALEDLHQQRIQAVVIVPNAWRINARINGPLALVASDHGIPAARAALEATLGTLRRGDVGSTDRLITSTAVANKSNFDFIFPGLLTLALLQLGLLATASPLLRARENRSLLHLSLTPISKSSIFLAQLALRLVVAAVQVSIVLLLGVVVFHVSVAGGYAILGLVALISATMLVAIGYAVAGLARSQEAGMAIVMALNFAMLFLGDIFFDFSKVPLLRPLMTLTPATYSADALRQAILGSSGVYPLAMDILVMAGLTVLAGIVAVRTFRFQMGEN